MLFFVGFICFHIVISKEIFNLDEMIFYNSGKIDNDDGFSIQILSSNYQEGYMYMDDINNNDNIQVGQLGWLFKDEPNGQYSVPPSGI